MNTFKTINVLGLATLDGKEAGLRVHVTESGVLKLSGGSPFRGNWRQGAMARDGIESFDARAELLAELRPAVAAHFAVQAKGKAKGKGKADKVKKDKGRKARNAQLSQLLRGLDLRRHADRELLITAPLASPFVEAEGKPALKLRKRMLKGKAIDAKVAGAVAKAVKARIVAELS